MKGATIMITTFKMIRYCTPNHVKETWLEMSQELVYTLSILEQDNRAYSVCTMIKEATTCELGWLVVVDPIG